MAKRVNNTAAKPRNEACNQAATTTEAEVLVKNAKAVRIDLANQVEEVRIKAGQAREQIHELAAKKDELDGKVAMMESRLADLDFELSRAETTARLTAGSEIEHTTRSRVADLQSRRNQLVMDLSETQDDVAVKKLLLDEQIAEAQRELSATVDAEERYLTALEEIARQETEARAQRGQELLQQYEADIAQAESEYADARAKAADAYQQAIELRMGAKEKLRDFGLSEDAERLAPQFERPITPAERVFETYHEFLVALKQSRTVRWDDALDVRGNPRRANQLLIEALAIPPNMMNEYLNGREMFLANALRQAEQYRAITQRTAVEPRRNG